MSGLSPQRRRIQRRSQAQERAVATDHGGEVQPGSGSGWRRPGDVRADRYLFECKTRADPSADSIRILGGDLRKVEQRALQSGRIPVLTFDIGRRRYHILTDADLAEMTDGSSSGR